MLLICVFVCCCSLIIMINIIALLVKRRKVAAVVKKIHNQKLFGAWPSKNIKKGPALARWSLLKILAVWELAGLDDPLRIGDKLERRRRGLLKRRQSDAEAYVAGRRDGDDHGFAVEPPGDEFIHNAHAKSAFNH